MAILQMRTLRSQGSVVVSQLRACDEQRGVVLAPRASALYRRVLPVKPHPGLGLGHTQCLLHRYKLPRVYLNTGLKASFHDSTYRSDLCAEASLFAQLSDPKEAEMSTVGGCP